MLFRSKDTFTSAFLPYHTDIHSHLLPGIDDGARSVEHSLELLTTMAQLGIKHAYTTPHIRNEKFPNTSHTILQSLELLRKRCEISGLPLDLHVAAEYFLDEFFLDTLKSSDSTLMSLGEKYILFELPFVNESMHLYQAVYEIQQRGYVPLLAHPERYEYMLTQKNKYHEWHERGILFQLNINSAMGFYSKESHHLAHWLIKEGLVDALGSDTHHKRHLEYLGDALQEKWFKQLCQDRLVNYQLGEIA